MLMPFSMSWKKKKYIHFLLPHKICWWWFLLIPISTCFEFCLLQVLLKIFLAGWRNKVCKKHFSEITIYGSIFTLLTEATGSVYCRRKHFT